MSRWQVDDLLRPLLIAVTDRRRLPEPMPDWAKRVIDGGIDLIHLREKDLSEDELRPLAISVLTALESPDQLQINGHQQLAIELGCGLHLPEAMLSIAHPQRSFIRSIHGFETIASPVAPDFLVAGHLFPTLSKASIPARG